MDETDKAIRIAIETQHIVGNKSANDDNTVIARYTLHEELGYRGERREPYHLDQDTRDILLAHTRQDAAHSLLNTISLLKKVDSLALSVRRLLWLSSALLICVLILLFHSINSN